MYTIILVLFLIIGFLWYQSSKKVKFGKRPNWLIKQTENRKKLTLVSLAILLACILVICYLQGLGSGLFTSIVYLMGSFCLIIILSPYQIVKLKHLVMLFSICFMLELLINYTSNH